MKNTHTLATRQETAKPSALSLMAERCAVDPANLVNILKNTVIKNATDDEFRAFVIICNSYELNPILKEIHAFKGKSGGITPMVGIDGWLKIANRQANFDGMEVEVYGDGKTPTHATCEIFLKDRAHSVKITEYFDECKRATDPWTQMPRRMLRNKVIIQAIRVAFGIGGIHDEDEAEDISKNAPRDVSPRQKGLPNGNVIDPFEKTEQVETVETVVEESEAQPAPEDLL